MLAILLLVLCLGLRLCYKARALPSDLNESAWISLALLVQFQSLIMAVPVLATTASSPLSSYVFKVVIVFTSSTGTILLLFMPKLWRIHGWGDSGSDSQRGSAKGSHGKVGDGGVIGSTKASGKRSKASEGKPGGLWNNFKSGPSFGSSVGGDASEARDSFLVATVVSAAAEYQQKQGIPKPSSASLDAVTGGALHNKVYFLLLMTSSLGLIVRTIVKRKLTFLVVDNDRPRNFTKR